MDSGLVSGSIQGQDLISGRSSRLQAEQPTEISNPAAIAGSTSCDESQHFKSRAKPQVHRA